MEKIKLDEFTRFHFLSNLQASPSQDIAAFIVSKASEDLLKYDTSLYLVDNSVHKLLDHVSNYCWFDDHTLLVQTKKGEGEIEFSYLDVNTLKLKNAFTLPLLNASITAKKDFLVIGSKIDVHHPDFYRYDVQQRAQYFKEKQENADYEIIDEIPFYYNAKGFVNKTRQALFVMNLQGSNQLLRISEAEENIISYCVKDDWIYYLADFYTVKETRRPKLFAYQVQTQEKILLYEPELQFKHIGVMSDDLILLGSDFKQHGKHQNLTMYRYSINEKKLSLYYDNQQSLVNSVNSDCRYGSTHSLVIQDDGIYCCSTINDHCELVKFTNLQSPETIFSPMGTVDDFALSPNKIFTIAMIDNALQEIYCLDKKSKDTVQLTHFNEEILKNKYVSDYTPISVESRGLTVDGWILTPKDFDSTKKYPGILCIHGGPNTAYGCVFHHEMQAWSNEGYFVFFCNPLGSDGKGNQFADVRGQYGITDYENIMDFTDEVLRQTPNLDKNRLAVTGGSYGGFMVNWIIGHTDRFACAISQRSISNWTSLIGVSDLGYRFALDQNKVDDFQHNFDKLWWHSPIKYAYRATTPTLFIHSDEDYRCPLEQGIQMVRALMEIGTDTRLCMFRKENHELSRSGTPKHRLRRLEEMTNWIKKYTQ